MKNGLRQWMRLIESKQPTIPKILYHGTNPVAATLILMDRHISAFEPFESDTDGEIVCTSASSRVAGQFAYQFAGRTDFEHRCGAVFALDAARLATMKIFGHASETASFDEKEYRIHGDIPLSACVGLRLVGETRLLRSQRYLHLLWEAVEKESLDDRWDGQEGLFQKSIATLIASVK